MSPLLLLLNAILSVNIGALCQSHTVLTCHRQNSVIANALRSMKTLVMNIDTHAEDCKVQHYRGSMYGVTAKVELNLKRREAKVQLYGIPIGGTVEGMGWLVPNNGDADGEQGGVDLEDDFAARLARRMVSIEKAKLDRVRNVMEVTVNVPFFGQQTLVLERDSE